MKLLKELLTLAVIIRPNEITSALVDISSNKLLKESLNHLGVDLSYSQMEKVEIWCKVIETSLKAAPNSGQINLSVQGPFNYTSGISYKKENNFINEFYPFDLGRLISENLGPMVKLKFFNPACCLLKGQQIMGRIPTDLKTLAFTIDDSFGSALSLSNKVSDVNYWSYPFKNGICNDYFSEPWFTKYYVTATGKAISNLNRAINLIGEEAIDNMLGEFTNNMSTFISEIYKRQSLDCIVLGGQYSEIWNVSIRGIKTQLAIDGIDLDISIPDDELHISLLGAVNL